MRSLRDTSGLDQIKRDMEYFCVTVGQRLAGAPEEKKAAEYTSQRFQNLGLSNVECLPFSCRRWVPGKSELMILDSPQRAIACETLAHSVSTSEEGVEGELVILEPVDYERGLRRDDLAGKIGLFHGSYGESAAVFEELQKSLLEALLFVDTRLMGANPIAEGMGGKFMRYVRKPMANVSLMDAWSLAREGVRRVRLTSMGQAVDAASQNVVAELPGSDPSGNIIVICGHIDSVALGVGADDNASGIAAMLECAKRLKERQPCHTLRFIGFGAEEQLSLGSFRYVTEQVKDLDRVAFVCNFDGIAAWLGISEVMTVGTPALQDYVRKVVEQKQQFGWVVPTVSPYQDHFPFAVRGIPGIWFTRKTHQNMYWYHHSQENDLDVCSIKQIARTSETACEILADLAAKETWPFPREIPHAMTESINRYFHELFE